MFEFARSIVLKGQKKPFFVFRPIMIHRAFEKWREYLPTVTPFFAMKANNHAFVLETIAETTINVDCASQKEMADALNIFGTLEGAIYSHPCKDVDHLHFARDNGLPLTVVDSVEEVQKVKRFYPAARLLCRIAVSNEHSRVVLGNKFGCSPDKLREIVTEAKGMDLRGVSFHVGSACGNTDSFVNAIEQAHEALSYTGGNIVNIGGGFTTGIFESAAVKLRKSLLPNLVYIAEPGRFMVESSFGLFLQITTKRHLVDDIVEYTVNDGLYGALNNMLYDKFPAKIYPFCNDTGKLYEPFGKQHLSRFWGPSCDGLDILTPIPIPFINVEEGDWVYVPNAGAYVNPGAEFNGFPVADVFKIG